MSLTSPNKAVAQRFLTALGAFDTEAAALDMHSEYTAHFPTITMRPDTYDAAQMLTFIRGMQAALPDGIRFDFVAFTEEDDRVSVVARGNAITVDGKPYNNNYHFLFYLKDQKIYKHLEFMDSYLAVKVMAPLLRAGQAAS